MSDAVIRCPRADAHPQTIARFALSYDGYGRMGRDAASLARIARPVVERIQHRGHVPQWAGLGLMRAALCLLQRQAHFTEYTEAVNEREMRVLVSEIALHADGQLLTDDYGSGERIGRYAEGFARRDRARSTGEIAQEA